MNAKGLFVFLTAGLLTFAAPKIANAITLQEAKNAVDTAFTRQFGSNYNNNILFWDGSAQREAYAHARSVYSGYNLINTSIGTTFDMNTDSTGADDEGTTVLKMNYPEIPTQDSALVMTERFLERVVQGPSIVEGNPETKKYLSNISFGPNPTNGKVKFDITSRGLSDIVIGVYDILGREKRTITQKVKAGNYEIEWDGKDKYGNKLSNGPIIYKIKNDNVINTKRGIILK